MLIAVGGLVASGKSTVARLLARSLAAPRVEADEARRQLVADDDPRGLAAEFEDHVYAEMLRRACCVLESGRPVILDACFPRRSERERARRLALERGWSFLFVECRVDEATTRARLAARDHPERAGAWLEIYERLARRWQSTEDLPARQHLVLDCSRSLDEAAAALRERVAGFEAGTRLP
jgi:predicted kinase